MIGGSSMSWHYGDWSWAYTWTNTAALIMVGVVLAAAIVNLVRSRHDDRHEEVVLTSRLADDPQFASVRERHHAPLHDGSRAA
jgi:hypothetical protein